MIHGLSMVTEKRSFYLGCLQGLTKKVVKRVC